MNIEFDSYKQKLNECRPALEGLADSLNLEGLRNELERFQAMQEAPGFWDDPDKSQKIVVKAKQTEAKITRYEAMCGAWDDLMTICEMAAEEDDDSMLEELKEGYADLIAKMEACRLETLLTGKYDKNNAMMSFQAGAGGTEAQDWCQMLYRMYTRWAERHGFTYKIMDYQEGDEAGLKSASIMIEGENAYGFLKGENGVHRLVRVSPFDANARRQTSFAAVEVMPEIEEIAKKNAEASGGSFTKVNSMEEAFKDADIVYPKSWAPFKAMEKRTELYREGDKAGIDALEKELLAQNAQHKDWACTEDMMKLTKDGKALYMHCLPADISGVSCKEGEVDASVFDRYMVPLYKQASFKPYIIAAMIFLSKVKDPVGALREMEKRGEERKAF